MNEFLFDLPEESLREEFFRPSAGPGGQKVNKTQNGVRLFLKPELAFSDEKMIARLRTLAGKGQLTEAGEIFTLSWGNRSLLRNREEAREKLHALIAAALIQPRKRKKTRPGRGAIERRLESKKRNSEKKRFRSQLD